MKEIRELRMSGTFPSEFFCRSEIIRTQKYAVKCLKNWGRKAGYYNLIPLDEVEFVASSYIKVVLKKDKLNFDNFKGFIQTTGQRVLAHLFEWFMTITFNIYDKQQIDHIKRYYVKIKEIKKQNITLSGYNNIANILNLHRDDVEHLLSNIRCMEERLLLDVNSETTILWQDKLESLNFESDCLPGNAE